ncbi:MAG: threonine synthase [Pelovirga sp.]
MKYCSTRGGVNDLSFSEAVMMGLAADGGLLLPQHIPVLSPGELQRLSTLPYPDLAFDIISRYATDLPADDLQQLINRTYANFRHPDIAPVVKRDDLYILELFHGPTLAFKDIALQFLGNLFEYYLERSGAKMNIIGATSGDTGSAAIAGVRGRKNINIFILYPHGRVSAVQELQMTTVADENVFNIAIDGTFDDAQAIVKEIFGDQAFKQQYALGAVNSINWVRVLAQVVYYFYACFQVQRDAAAEMVDFSVPTGNFGDIFAGYIARRMGLPIRSLILATNSNNILSRFVNQGDYSVAAVHQTLSPSMDIQVASNFERYLYYLYDCQPDKVVAAMAAFRQHGKIAFSAAEQQRIRSDFAAASVDDSDTVEQIRSFYHGTGYLLDPHTAVGVAAGQLTGRGQTPLICLATAHPAKFPDAIHQAVADLPIDHPVINQLRDKPQHRKRMPADLATIRSFIAANAC